MFDKQVTWKEFLNLYRGDDQELLKTLHGIKTNFKPDGFFMLRCEMMDSSRLGEQVIWPFGGKATYAIPPRQPVSPRGLASDMSVVVAVLPIELLPPLPSDPAEDWL